MAASPRTPFPSHIPRRRPASSGFSLVETVVAIGMTTAAIVALAQLLAIATMNNRLARNASMAAILAQQKMEHLRGSNWTALSPSPGDSLDESREGWADYLDERGIAVGGGSAPPPGTVYVRRWSIEPLPEDPGNTLVLHVLVTPLIARRTVAPSSRMPGDARLVTVRTRKP